MRGKTRRQAPGVGGERGAAAVEFVLVLPILLILLVGTVTAGLAFSRSIGLANAVREGSRFGATADVSGTWAQDVIKRTRETQFDDGGDQSSSYTSICVELRGGATPVGPVCSSGALGTVATPVFGGTVPTGECVVLVYAARHYDISTGAFDPVSGDMQKWSVARHESDC